MRRQRRSTSCRATRSTSSPRSWRQRCAGKRVSAMFARPIGDRLELVVVIANDVDGVVELAAAELPRSYPSLTLSIPEVHLFERELAEQWGVQPVGHPWLKPV